MAEIPDNAAGISSTSGLNDWVIAGPLDEYGPMIGVLQDGVEYPYRAKAISESVTDYETGRGIWNSATNTLTRATIKTSSNNDNPVDWPSGTKSIFIVADEEALKDMGKMVETPTAKLMTGDERERIRNTVAPFPHKPKGEPILLVFTGQSNAGGVLQDAPDSMPINNRVFDLVSDVPLTPPYTFQVADPLRDSGFAGGVLVGMRGQTGGTPGSPFGNSGWSCANALANWLDRDVYMVQVVKSATPISAWADGGEVEVELSARVTQALSLLQVTWPNITYPDVVMWMQGGSDRGRDPEDYADDFIAFKENMESKWANKDYTQWTLATHNPLLNTTNYWSGIERSVERLGNNVSIISTDEMVFPDGLHLDGPSLNAVGVLNARQLIMPSSQPVATARDAKFLSWHRGDAMSDVDNDPNVTAFGFDTAASLTEATAKLASWKNAGLEKAYIDKDGNFVLPGIFSSAADGVNVVAQIIDTLNEIADATGKLLSIRNNGDEKAYFDKDGSLAAGGYHSDVASSASAVAHTFDTTNNLTHNGALIAQFKNQGVSKASLDKDGGLTVLGLSTNFLGGSLFSRAVALFDENVYFLSLMQNGTNRTAFRFNCAQTLSHTTAKLMDFQIGGVTKFSLNQAGQPIMSALPTADPGVPGQLWRDGGNFLRIS